MAVPNPFGSSTEKRYNSRKKCDRSAELVVDNVSIRCLMRNISIEGAYVETERAFDVGKEVTISFMHSVNRSQIMMKGTIVRVDEKGIAVKFRH